MDKSMVTHSVSVILVCSVVVTVSSGGSALLMFVISQLANSTMGWGSIVSFFMYNILQFLAKITKTNWIKYY